MVEVRDMALPGDLEEQGLGLDLSSLNVNQKRYLTKLVELPRPYTVCKLIQISHNTVKGWRVKNPNFAQAELMIREGVPAADDQLAIAILSRNRPKAAQKLVDILDIDATDPQTTERTIGHIIHVSEAILKPTGALDKPQEQHPDVEEHYIRKLWNQRNAQSTPSG